MTMNWTQQKYDCMTHAEREAQRYRRVCPKSLIPRPTPRIERPSMNRVEAESLPAARFAQWKRWSFGWDVILAALAWAAGIVAAVGNTTCFWGRVFARGAVRERQRFQDEADPAETSKAGQPDEFPLELNDRERTELLQLLEHSLPAATEGRKRSRDSEAIRRKIEAHPTNAYLVRWRPRIVNYY